MEKYVLYGAGWQAEKLLYNFTENESVAYYIDGFKTGTIHGINIYSLDSAPDIHKYKIIVTAIWENYEQIRKCLKERGLIEFQDFIWSEAFNKKLAVINANCHGDYYKRFLNQSKMFMEEYLIWDIPALYTRKANCIPDELLAACDLFIHQDIRVNNPYGYKFSDEYTLSHLKPGCRVLTVPNMVGMGSWNFPTAVTKDYRYPMRAMFCKDTLLDEAYNQYKTVDEIKRYITSPDVVPAEVVRGLFDKCMSKLKAREQNWDVTISDYILKYYKTKKLFYDYDHAADHVMREIGRRICSVLGITDIEEAPDYPLNWEESFTFPYVKEALGLTYEETYIRELGNCDIVLNGKKMDLDEYIREYVWWFYNERIE